MASSARNATWEPIRLSEADFNDGKDEGSSISAGDVAEVATMEVGEDGAAASYDFIQLGGNLDSGNQDSAQGKIYAELKDGGDSEVDSRTQMRLVTRPKNGNRRVALTDWYTEGDVNQSDTANRIPLPPVTRNGRRFAVSDGRIIALEVRNPATSVTVELDNTSLSFPAQAGY